MIKQPQFISSFQLFRGLLQPGAGNRPEMGLPRSHPLRTPGGVLGRLYLRIHDINPAVEHAGHQEGAGGALQAGKTQGREGGLSGTISEVDTLNASRKRMVYESFGSLDRKLFVYKTAQVININEGNNASKL